MSKYFPEPKSTRRRVKVELDLSNYAPKSNLNKLDIDKLKNIPLI